MADPEPVDFGYFTNEGAKVWSDKPYVFRANDNVTVTIDANEVVEKNMNAVAKSVTHRRAPRRRIATPCS